MTTKTQVKKPAAKVTEKKAAPAKTVTKAPAKEVAAKVTEKASVKKAASTKTVSEKKPSPKKAQAKKVAVVFEANCPLATTVSVAGSFNNWAIDKDMLKKDKKTGLWVGKVTLDAGEYEYKFVCDGIYWDEGENKIKRV